jgi:hypothetical protein
MRIAHAVSMPTGFFLFTSLSGHVDLAMANEVFDGLDGQPLRMTIRATRLVDSWAEALGYHVEGTRSDAWGDFSVTLARKRA